VESGEAVQERETHHTQPTNKGPPLTGNARRNSLCDGLTNH
jgi:hypothetical protein